MSDIHKLIHATIITDGLIERQIQTKQGVQIALNVYEALKPKGSIYKKMNKQLGVSIKVGSILKQDDTYVVVKNISW